MGRQGDRTRRAAGMVCAFTFAAAVMATAVPGADGSERSARVPAASPSTRAALPDSIVDRYLERRPTLGPVTVVDVSGEPGDRRLLAATLQGIVNRTQARMYLVGMRSHDEDQYWLDSYVARGLITIHATVGLDAALATFAPEVAGYVMASDAEPWTIDTATTVAGVKGAVVATASTVAALQGVGLTQLADHVGRWTDATTAYESIAKTYRAKIAYQGIAIQKADAHDPRDFFVQQGMLVISVRPSDKDFERLYGLLDLFPDDRPVYGYVSDTGDEETQAIVHLALKGRFLVPTDTTDNLSFHIAVGGPDRVRVPTRTATVTPCDPGTVNVAIAMSDGDNQVIPEAYYPRTDRWNSARRGEIPVGWGLSPAASVLMPAVWDLYAAGATPNDELVDLMGLGYAIPSLMPDETIFLADSARLHAALGLHSSWALDALLSDPAYAGWKAVDGAAASVAAPDGILLNYDKWPGPALFHSPTGIPVLASRQGSYGDGPAELAAQIDALSATPAKDRPLVTFFPATVWNASYDALADALGPRIAAGVRVMTPAEAFACLPKFVRPTTTTTPTTTTLGAITPVTATTSVMPPAGPTTPAGAAEPVAATGGYAG
jgi:hypothetical protein